MPVPENAVTRTATFVVVPIFDVSEILCLWPRRPALLEVRGKLHDAETLLAIGANGSRVNLHASGY